MIEWVVIFGVAALGMLAFFFLFSNSPAGSTEQHKSQSRAPKEKREKQPKPQRKQVKEAKYDDDATSRAVGGREEEMDIVRHYTSRGEKETPTYAPTMALSGKGKKEEKKEKVAMPTKKQIDKDLSQGFVVVSKKGPPPLTADQKKEREAARLKEEQDKIQKEKDNAEREKKRQKERQEKSNQGSISPEQLKKQFDAERAAKAEKAEKAANKQGGVVKNYGGSKSEVEGEEKKEAKRWDNLENAEEERNVDSADYPYLRQSE